MEEFQKPLRIVVFGGLRIWLGGEPIDLEKIGGSKPLELLKFIIAYGGKNVSTDFAASKLWASSEGDNAAGALNGTLLRLRKILGIPDALILKGGMLNLNSQICWLDTWALDRLSHKSWEHIDRGTMTLALARDHICQLHLIVRGPCFLSESDLPWVYLMQNKSKSKFSRLVLGLGNFLMQQECSSEAAALYERALDFYPLSEEICIKLIEARIAQGLTTEALLVFKRFEHILRDTLGMAPSKALLDKFQHAKLL